MGTRTAQQIRHQFGYLKRCALKPKPPPKRKRAKLEAPQPKPKRAKLAAPPRSIEADPHVYTTTRADRARR